MLQNTARLLELHGANLFQVRHYREAATDLAKVDQEVDGLSLESLGSIAKLQPSTARLIQEINTTGTLQRWERLAKATPRGVLEMLDLQGIGPKKVWAIWKDLGVTSLSALSQACATGQIAKLVGFGEKTQEMIQRSLDFKIRHMGYWHYASALSNAKLLEEKITEAFPVLLISWVGAFRRKMEVVNKVEMLIGTTRIIVVAQWLDQLSLLQKQEDISGPFAWRGQFVGDALPATILFCDPKEFYKQLIWQTGSQKHLALPISDGKQLGDVVGEVVAPQNEAAIYTQAKLPYIPPELREGQIEYTWANRKEDIPLLEIDDLEGVFHVHTTYSDGKHSLREMALHCRHLGYGYVGITDHSKQAVYAGGLTLEAIKQQHQEIDQLNETLAPFKIFKGIEADILKDGSLDYTDSVLASFDFVIASVHTSMNMSQQQATKRLIKAIRNPHTTMLAHLTNRLLLKREGFPIDHRAVIDACADYGVMIEINANPWRLELEWRWVAYALEKDILISINPDAHDKESIQNIHYGVEIGRKGGLTRSHTFNVLPQKDVIEHFKGRKANFIRS